MTTTTVATTAPTFAEFVCPTCGGSIGALPTAAVWCFEHGDHVRCDPAPEHAETVATARRRASEASKKQRYRRRQAVTSNGGHRPRVTAGQSVGVSR